MTVCSREGETALNSYQQEFHAVMERQGRHVTRQRLSVAATLHAMGGHPTVEEVHDALRKAGSGTGLTTVYRTVKLLKDAGLVMEFRGEDGSARYEAVGSPKHHDHFVCRDCGAVLEISCPELERAQSELARQYGFFPEAAAHCVYGLCAACHAGRGA